MDFCNCKSTDPAGQKNGAPGSISHGSGTGAPAAASCGCETVAAATSACGCGQKLPAVAPEAGLVLAMATVPMQPWESIYEPAVGLRQGTIFPGLDKPFYVTGGGAHV